MNKFVALIDILGFKDIIQKNSHEKVVHLFDNFRVYLQMGIADYKSTEDQWGRAVFDVSQSVVNSTIISDSIILWTTDSSTEAFFELVKCIQRFTSFCHNNPMISLRGGITFGEFYYDYSGVIKGKDSLMVHPIMRGKALVGVYEIEKTLQFAGCIITEAALDAAKAPDEPLFQEHWQELEKDQKVIQYDVPIKAGSMRTWTINWVSKASNPTYEKIKDGFSSYNKSIDATDVRTKMENTLKYFSYVKENVFGSTTEQESA